MRDRTRTLLDIGSGPQLIIAVALVATVGARPPEMPTRVAVRTAQRDTSRTVTAGDSLVDAGRLALGRTEKHLRVVRGDSVRDYGALVQILTRVTLDGAAGLLSVQYSPHGRFPTDSAFSDPRTLRPLWQRSHSTRRDMRLEFEGSRIGGSYAPGDSAARGIDQTLAAPPFDANVGDLVVAALPLEVGRVFRVPTYIYEAGGLVWERVEVRGRERYRLGSRTLRVYRVEASDPGGSTTYLITTDAPRIVVETVRDLGARGKAVARLEP